MNEMIFAWIVAIFLALIYTLFVYGLIRKTREN
jgi:hypothetical protein